MNSYVKTGLYLSLFTFGSVVYGQAESKSSDNVPSTKEVKSGAITSEKEQKKTEETLSRLEAKIASAQTKLDEDRIGGELPGDYIAAREAKIAKLKRKKELLGLSKDSLAVLKPKSSNEILKDIEIPKKVKLTKEEKLKKREASKAQELANKSLAKKERIALKKEKAIIKEEREAERLIYKREKEQAKQQKEKIKNKAKNNLKDKAKVKEES